MKDQSSKVGTKGRFKIGTEDNRSKQIAPVPNDPAQTVPTMRVLLREEEEHCVHER